MKKRCSFLIILTLLITGTMSSPLVFAEQFESVPTIFTRIAHDDFTNTDIEGRNMPLSANESFPTYSTYTGGEGFADLWKYNAALNADVPYRETGISNSNPSFYVNSDGQLVKEANTPIYRQLSNPIDLGVDAEYYLVYTYTSINRDSYFSWLQVGKTGTTPVERVISVGERQAGKNIGYRAVTSVFYANNTEQLSTHVLPADGTTQVTCILHISARAGTVPDVYQLRAFPLVEGQEEPSFYPSYWDLEHRVANTAANQLLDLVALRSYSNSSSVTTYMDDEISIYKGTSIYVDKTHTGSETPPRNQPFTTYGDTLTLNIAEKNILDADQQILSQEWQDCTDPQNPITISLPSDTSFTVPDTMVGRRLRLKAVIKDSEGVETTIYPFNQYISNKYEVDTSFFTNGVASYARLTSAPAEDATKIGVRVVVRRTNTVAADKINNTATVFIAQYADGNKLKRVFSATGNLSVAANATVTINPNITDLSVEAGDYFKSFVWVSGAMMPISFSKNSQAPFLVNDTRMSLN